MRPLKINPGHAITALTLSPDGQKLGVVQSAHGFRLFDALTGTELGRDMSHENVFESSPTERHSLQADRTAVRIAEVATGRPFLRFQTGWTRAGAFNRPPQAPDTSALHRAIAVYQFGQTLNSGLPSYGPHPPVGRFAMHDCALTADHRFIVGRRVSSDAWYSVCDLATEAVAAKLTFPEWLPTRDRAQIVFTRDGTRAVAVTRRTLAVFDLPPPAPLDAPAPPAPVVSPTMTVRVTQPQPDPELPPFAVLPCGQKALLRGEKSRVELRDLTTGEVLTVWKWGLPRVNALAVAGDELTAAAGGASGRVVMWDLG
jgi:hypothetical protein